MSRVPRTHHAQTRQAQRAVRDVAVDAAMAWGRELRAGKGHLFLFVGTKEVAFAARFGVDVSRHAGTTLVLLPTGWVKTVWRGPRPPREADPQPWRRRTRRVGPSRRRPSLTRGRR